MCGNNCFGGGNLWWIIILLLLFCNCGCGGNICGNCGNYDNNNNCGCGCGC